MENVLITGAGGFVGKNLIEYLKDKYNIFAPLHSELDLLNEIDVKKYIIKNKIDIVIHTANVGGNRKQIASDIVYKNLRMFFNLVRCKSSFKKMIHLGTGGEYDKRSELHRISEEDFDKSVPCDDYSFSKYIMSKYIETTDNIVNLRIFGLFGKYEDFEYKFISNAIVKNLLNMPILIKQNAFFDYLYIDDFMRVIEWFIDNTGNYKFYNVTTGRSVDIYTIAQVINQISDFKSEIKILNKGLNYEYSGDNSRLLRQIPGLQFTPLEKSIYQLFKYYKTIIHNINKSTIIDDPYSKKCTIKQYAR